MFSSISEILPSSDADRPREVAEVIGRERDVGGQRLTHRLAVLVALCNREHLHVLVDRVGDGIQDGGSIGR